MGCRGELLLASSATASPYMLYHQPTKHTSQIDNHGNGDDEGDDHDEFSDTLAWPTHLSQCALTHQDSTAAREAALQALEYQVASAHQQ